MWIMAMIYCVTFSNGDMCKGWVPPIAETTQERCEQNIKRAVYAMANAIDDRNGKLFYIDCQCINVKHQ
jgi:hypothetical protein